MGACQLGGDEKCYNIESSPKILHQLDVNEENFILTWNSGSNNMRCNDGEGLFLGQQSLILDQEQQ